jgi:glycerophosphoryl diester phosphodiesterase
MTLKIQIITLFLSISSVVLAQSIPTMKTLDKQGHRGCRGLFPENTIQGFLKAIDLGVTTLEMDAVITKDKQVILSHEPFFNHEISTLPNEKHINQAEEKEFNIYKMKYCEVTQYDVGLKPHPRFPQQQKVNVVKPLLSEVIDAVEMYAKTNQTKPLFYNIETKTEPQTDGVFHPEPKEFVELLMKIILQKKIENRVIIQSFDRRTLQYLHQKYPTITTALLVEDFDKKEFKKQIANLGFLPSIYSPAQELVTQELIQECHQKNVKLIPWTVNDPKKIKEFIAMGVDGIISDYPNLFD